MPDARSSTTNPTPPLVADGPTSHSRGHVWQPPPRLSLPRLYALRAGYLLIGIGLAVTTWPGLFSQYRSWTVTESVVNCMFAALALLALIGVRYPIRMLPVLLFESAWKLIWFAAIALPLWTTHRMDPVTQAVAAQCLLVVPILVVIPWRYVFAHYVTKRGDRWRADRPRPAQGQL
jgi:hypothetical protein